MTENADVETAEVLEPISDAEADAQWERISAARRRVGEVLVEREPLLTLDVDPETQWPEWDARVDGPLVWAIGQNFGSSVSGASLRLNRDVESAEIHRAVNEMCEAAIVTGAAFVPAGYVATAHRRAKYHGGAGISLNRMEDAHIEVRNEEEAVTYGALLAVDLRAFVTFVDALDLPAHFRSIVERHTAGVSA